MKLRTKNISIYIYSHGNAFIPNELELAVYYAQTPSSIKLADQKLLKKTRMIGGIGMHRAREVRPRCMPKVESNVDKNLLTIKRAVHKTGYICI